MENFNEFLVFQDIVAPLIALLLGVFLFYRNKRTIGYPDTLLVYFLICQVALNTTAPILQAYDINNHFVYHLNCLITVVIFTTYFLRSLNYKPVVVAGLCAFLIFWAINILWIQPYYRFNSYSYSMGAFFIVLCSLLNFREIITQMPTEKILSLKDFWILTGLLTYFGSCFFIFISYNYLSQIDSVNVGILWKIHNVFLSLGCVIFLKAFSCKQWTPKSS
jgi:hypothetical protein